MEFIYIKCDNNQSQVVVEVEMEIYIYKNCVKIVRNKSYELKMLTHHNFLSMWGRGAFNADKE